MDRNRILNNRCTPIPVGMTVGGVAAFPMMFASQFLGARGVGVVVCSAGAGLIAGGFAAWRVMHVSEATRRRLNRFYYITHWSCVAGLVAAGLVTLLWQHFVDNAGIPIVYCSVGTVAAILSATSLCQRLR